MKMEKLIYGTSCFIFGFLLMCGMRLAEYMIEKPKVRLLVCVAEDDEIEGACSPFDEFIKKKDS